MPHSKIGATALLKIQRVCRWAGLTVFAAAQPVFADVCANERPGWDGTPPTAWDEALHHFVQPHGLFILGAMAVAVLFRHTLGVGIACVMWAFYVTAVVMRGDTQLMMAQMEGCVGSPSLFVVLVAAISLAAVLYTIRREKRL